MNTRRQPSRKLISPSRYNLALLLLCSLVLHACGYETKPPPVILAPPVVVANPVSAPTAVQATAAKPAATLTTTAVWSSGTESVPGDLTSTTAREHYWFSEEDCGCAAFPATVDARYGPGVLECNYRWGGTYIDDNNISFSIVQYDASADLEKDFAESLGWFYDSAQDSKRSIDSGSAPGQEQYIARNETNGFTYIDTGPGGGSSKTEGEIPMCGNGSGIIKTPGDYLVEIHLFACDLGDDRSLYQTAIETLEDCALSNIAKAQAAAP